MKYGIVIWKLLAGCVLAALAAVFIYGAIFIAPATERDWRAVSTETVGTVIELRETYRSRAYCDHLVIQYGVPGGRSLSFTPYDCYSKGAYRVGQRVNMRYKTDNPSIAYIDLGNDDRSSSIIMIVMGVVLLACASGLLYSSFRKREAA